MTTSAPIFTPLAQVSLALRRDGYALLPPQDVAALAGCTPAQLDALTADWDALELDNYLKDGGRYRRRRHACFIQDGAQLRQTRHRPHWQPLEYNALHGGMQRLFAPMLAQTLDQPAWRQLLTAIGDACTAARSAGAGTAADMPAAQPWFVEAHQFRIDTADGIGRPTPEGAHRDGVDFVAVILIARQQIKGGETRVFEADGPNGKRFTMTEPWTMLLLDDAAVIHESTPIQPLAGQGGDEHQAAGHRDTLVLTYRARAFQGQDEPAA